MKTILFVVSLSAIFLVSGQWNLAAADVTDCYIGCSVANNACLASITAVNDVEINDLRDACYNVKTACDAKCTADDKEAREQQEKLQKDQPQQSGQPPQEGQEQQQDPSQEQQEQPPQEQPPQEQQ